MAIKVDNNKAKRVLLLAFNNRKQLSGSTASKITDVLTGSHKTYRYVLITALLAKATDERVDVYSLQAQDESNGAYDARSLCHNVIVKFERDYLPDGLGGSNEPYLNKPARFPRISLSNAVRKGNDTVALHKLIAALQQITNKEGAFDYLCHAVYIMERTHKESENKFTIDEKEFNGRENLQDILDYVSAVCQKSYEGEVCPLVISAIEQLYLGNNYKVVPHKVNESGASSKEVGDIDIFDSKGNIMLSIEVKDKVFSKEDVEHAIRKFYESRVKRSYFIYGKNIHNIDRVNVNQILRRFGHIGYYCCLISIMDYSKLRLAELPETNLSTYVDLLLQYARTIKASDETIEWIKENAKSNE